MSNSATARAVGDLASAQPAGRAAIVALSSSPYSSTPRGMPCARAASLTPMTSCRRTSRTIMPPPIASATI